MIEQNRTFCKYGDCSLEKLDNEFIKLKEIWDELKSNWAFPTDYENVYKVYPLLDTTAVLARKRLYFRRNEWSKYNIKIIESATENDIIQKKDINTINYYYSEDYELYLGKTKSKTLNDVVSTFIHANQYVYKDTRTDEMGINEFEIYLKTQTDIRTEFIKIDDYIKALGNFIADEIDLIN